MKFSSKIRYLREAKALEKRKMKKINNIYSLSVSAINFHWILSGNCRNLAFPSVFFFANKRLVKHKIRTVMVLDIDVCELLCYHDPNCVSVNFKSTSNSDGKYRCELNSATHQGRDDHFKDEEGYFYHGADVSISSKLLLLFFLLLVLVLVLLLLFVVVVVVVVLLLLLLLLPLSFFLCTHFIAFLTSFRLIFIYDT